MTVLDERAPLFTFGADDPTALDHLPEILWDDDATRPHPGLVAELEALYALEYTRPQPRPALPRRSELRNTPPNGIPVRTRRAPAPAPVRTPAPAVRTVETTRQRVMRTRTTKALVMALFVAADTYAAVTLAGPPAALQGVFGGDSAAAETPSMLSASAVLAGSAERAQSALDARASTADVSRSQARASVGRAQAALQQAGAADAREKAAAAAAEQARADALANAQDDPKSYARMMLADRGWNSSQFSCLSSLWHRESNWNYRASNSSSGAYGIPQSLPGSKMASAGSDWRTNPVTQMKWGLDYIADRYGTPCGAWAHSENSGWY